jgi:hypothetical protein
MSVERRTVQVVGLKRIIFHTEAPVARLRFAIRGAGIAERASDDVADTLEQLVRVRRDG